MCGGAGSQLPLSLPAVVVPWAVVPACREVAEVVAPLLAVPLQARYPSVNALQLQGLLGQLQAAKAL